MMEKKNIVLMCVVVLMFCFTQVTLDYFLPQAKTNFDVWMHYFIIKDALCDTMFFLMAVVVFSNVKGLLKAVACFFLFLAGGSFIDKVIFGLNQHLISDFILIVVSIALSIHLYFSKWKT